MQNMASNKKEEAKFVVHTQTVEQSFLNIFTQPKAPVSVSLKSVCAEVERPKRKEKAAFVKKKKEKFPTCVRTEQGLVRVAL